MDNNPAVLVITRSGTPRCTAISNHLAKLGLCFDVIEAVFPGNDEDLSAHHDEARRVSEVGYPLRRGEIGCFLSHRKAWEHIAKNKIKSALILEDDALLTGEAIGAITELTEAAGDKALAIRLVSVPSRRSRTWKILPMGVRICQPRGPVYLTVAYLITVTGAGRLLAASKRFWHPVDAFMTFEWLHGCAMMTTEPELAIHDDGGQSVIGARPKVTMGWVRRVRREIARSCEKWHLMRAQRRTRKTLGMID